MILIRYMRSSHMTSSSPVCNLCRCKESGSFCKLFPQWFCPARCCRPTAVCVTQQFTYVQEQGRVIHLEAWANADPHCSHGRTNMCPSRVTSSDYNIRKSSNKTATINKCACHPAADRERTLARSRGAAAAVHLLILQMHGQITGQHVLQTGMAEGRTFGSESFQTRTPNRWVWLLMRNFSH